MFVSSFTLAHWKQQVFFRWFRPFLTNEQKNTLKNINKRTKKKNNERERDRWRKKEAERGEENETIQAQAHQRAAHSVIKSNSPDRTEYIAMELCEHI